MSKSDDPERLLAEALRAQAVSAPVRMPDIPKVLSAQQQVAEPEHDEVQVEEADQPEVIEADQAADAEQAAEPDKAGDSGGDAVELTEEMMLRALTEGPTTNELATIRIEKPHHGETERFSPVDNVLGPVGMGPGFGLLSGSEVGHSAGQPAMAPEPPKHPVGSAAGPTMRMPAQRGQFGIWLIVLLAVVFGLAAGALAALISML